jgi:hypothetical protein
VPSAPAPPVRRRPAKDVRCAAFLDQGGRPPNSDPSRDGAQRGPNQSSDREGSPPCPAHALSGDILQSRSARAVAAKTQERLAPIRWLSPPEPSAWMASRRGGVDGGGKQLRRCRAKLPQMEGNAMKVSPAFLSAFLVLGTGQIANAQSLSVTPVLRRPRYAIPVRLTLLLRLQTFVIRVQSTQPLGALNSARAP